MDHSGKQEEADQVEGMKLGKVDQAAMASFRVEHSALCLNVANA
jgi:hypothetical protein